MARPKAKRYYRQQDAIAAAKKHCEANWSDLIGVDEGPLSVWSTELDTWFRATPHVKELSRAANVALQKVQDALAAIDAFDSLQKRLEDTEKLLPTAQILREWIRHHRHRLADLGRYSSSKLSPTPRQLLVLRSQRSYRFFRPLRIALNEVIWSNTKLAAVSLLVDNVPTISCAKLARGVTAAQVLNVEAEFMKKSILDLEKKLASASELKRYLKSTR